MLPIIPPLPTTSYGYTPPSAATARGWRCPQPRCAATGTRRPDGRALRCPRCGGPADAEFDQPWAHQARGMWLAHQRHRATDAQVKARWHAELQAWRTIGAPAPFRESAAGLSRPQIPGQRPSPAAAETTRPSAAITGPAR